jgi:hypothetical protein
MWELIDGSISQSRLHEPCLKILPFEKPLENPAPFIMKRATFVSNEDHDCP